VKQAPCKLFDEETVVVESISRVLNFDILPNGIQSWSGAFDDLSATTLDPRKVLSATTERRPGVHYSEVRDETAGRDYIVYGNARELKRNTILWPVRRAPS
jgi:hypothetical protein